MKLTLKDLNTFKIELNSEWGAVLFKAKKLHKIKNKYSNKQVTKEEVKAVEQEYKDAKEQFKALTLDTKFKDFEIECKRTLDNTAETGVNYSEIKEEYELSKHLHKESKQAIKNKGKNAELSKRNDISIKVENLSFKYKTDHPYVLKDVNFEIKHGEYVTIIGHNGSGKSTLSKLLIGVLKANEGNVSIYGNKINSSTIKYIIKFMGIVFQNPDNQFIGSTVKDDIAFGLENRQMDPALMPAIIEEVAKKVRMEKFLDHEPLLLSGGQKQRVAIASALALSPDILIFDEASSMLDPKGKRDVKEIMLNLRKNENKTIISITHDMDEILNADKVIVMNHGEMVRCGKPFEILKDKEFIRSIKLDVPFITLMEDALNEVGVKIGHVENIDDLVGQICQK
ncbi:energy-coupling factor transporter ATPase [Spiroplasma endosymbiont of Othius punctulatus]|uniref:energy-coupling factor transporter ATPase n=1 Tax=Spiroplasma endosymbiont of Othius punctulatus TaxID=3066289 RepID=UPI0030D323D0